MMISKSIKLNETTISYLDNEKSSELTVVFIHGNSSRKEAWLKQLSNPELSQYHLIALDLPGHGQTQMHANPSEDLEIYSYRYYYLKCAEFLRALGRKRIVLVGHSLGGHIAISATKEVSEVCGLVISQTPPLDTMEQAALGFNTLVPVLQTLYNPAATHSEIESLINLFALSAQLKEEIKASWPLTDQQFRINFSTSLNSELKANEAKTLAAMKSPWLILESVDDESLQHSYFLNNELFRSHMVEISGVLHYPQFEAPDEYNRELLKYLKNL